MAAPAGRECAHEHPGTVDQHSHGYNRVRTSRQDEYSLKQDYNSQREGQARTSSPEGKPRHGSPVLAGDYLPYRPQDAPDEQYQQDHSSSKWALPLQRLASVKVRNYSLQSDDTQWSSFNNNTPTSQSTGHDNGETYHGSPRVRPTRSASNSQLQYNAKDLASPSASMPSGISETSNAVGACSPPKHKQREPLLEDSDIQDMGEEEALYHLDNSLACMKMFDSASLPFADPSLQAHLLKGRRNAISNFIRLISIHPAVSGVFLTSEPQPSIDYLYQAMVSVPNVKPSHASHILERALTMAAAATSPASSGAEPVALQKGTSNSKHGTPNSFVPASPTGDAKPPNLSTSTPPAKSTIPNLPSRFAQAAHTMQGSTLHSPPLPGAHQGLLPSTDAPTSGRWALETAAPVAIKRHRQSSDSASYESYGYSFEPAPSNSLVPTIDADADPLSAAGTGVDYLLQQMFKRPRTSLPGSCLNPLPALQTAASESLVAAAGSGLDRAHSLTLSWLDLPALEELLASSDDRDLLLSGQPAQRRGSLSGAGSLLSRAERMRRVSSLGFPLRRQSELGADLEHDCLLSSLSCPDDLSFLECLGPAGLDDTVNVQGQLGDTEAGGSHNAGH